MEILDCLSCGQKPMRKDIGIGMMRGMHQTGWPLLLKSMAQGYLSK